MPGHRWPPSPLLLHPVFGPGEDRNVVSRGSLRALDPGCTRSSDRVRIATASTATPTVKSSSLHPVFGPGEDRNAAAETTLSTLGLLHPVFGPGEDRNVPVSGPRGPLATRCTRSSDRVRIATTAWTRR